MELIARQAPSRDRAAKRGNRGVSDQAVTAPGRFEEALENIVREPRRQAGDELLEALAIAPKDGWAGEGSNAISFLAYQHARDLLAALPSRWPPPDIAGGVDGRIEFDWFVAPGHRLTVSVGNSDRLPWTAVLGSDRKRGVCRFVSTFPDDLHDVLAKLYA